MTLLTGQPMGTGDCSNLLHGTPAGMRLLVPWCLCLGFPLAKPLALQAGQQPCHCPHCALCCIPACILPQALCLAYHSLPACLPPSMDPG